MTEYEAALVLRPTLDDERVQASIARYSQVIEQRGGEVEQPNIWGKRRLSYEIKGENDGVYVFLLYKAGSDVNAELDRLMRIDENVLRHLLVVRPLPNPPKPISVPEGGGHGDGPRSMPSHTSEGSVPMPKPKSALPVAADAPKAAEDPAQESEQTAQAEQAEVSPEEPQVTLQAEAPAEDQPEAETEAEAETETPTSETE